MVSLITALLVLPWVFAALVLFLPDRFRSILIQVGSLLLSILAILTWVGMGNEAVTFDAPIDELLLIADFVLLVYFVKQGFHYKKFLVWGLALLQIALLAGLLFIKPHEAINNFYVDSLSVFMYLLINIVGGIIVVYAVQYMRDEECSDSKKRYFLAILLGFLGTMNFIVSVDNIKWFFLLFEMTTLASYLLIRFRMDEISLDNALRALWMNQIGGIAILFALIFASLSYGTVHFSVLLAKGSEATLTLLPFAMLAIAAMVKGAQIPFDKWLLGAMVAPTPVSAILHSATMVKIAPFVIIKISPVIAGTITGQLVMLIGGLVFVAAGLIALNRDIFKEVLAYSTIALLGLMIMLGAMGSTLSITAALILIIFHGIAKALLFMEAGVLEKIYHAKYLQQADCLNERAPKTTFMILLGFTSLTLPPYGAFVGKWLAIEQASMAAGESLLHLMMLLAIVLGSVVLSLIYFRILGVILVKRGSFMKFDAEKLPYLYELTTYSLGWLLIITALTIAPLSEHFFGAVAHTVTQQVVMLSAEGWTLVFGNAVIPMWYVLIAMGFLLLPMGVYFIHLRGMDRVKEYACAERMEINFSPYFFDISAKYGNQMKIIGIVLFALTAIGGAL